MLIAGITKSNLGKTAGFGVPIVYHSFPVCVRLAKNMNMNVRVVIIHVARGIRNMKKPTMNVRKGVVRIGKTKGNESWHKTC